MKWILLLPTLRTFSPGTSSVVTTWPFILRILVSSTIDLMISLLINCNIHSSVHLYTVHVHCTLHCIFVQSEIIFYFRMVSSLSVVEEESSPDDDVDLSGKI